MALRRVRVLVGCCCCFGGFEWEWDRFLVAWLIVGGSGAVEGSVMMSMGFEAIVFVVFVFYSEGLMLRFVL